MHSLCQRGYETKSSQNYLNVMSANTDDYSLYIGMRSALNLKRMDLVGFKSQENQNHQNSLQKQVFAILFRPVMW
jgi:hypothetical protein